MSEDSNTIMSTPNTPKKVEKEEPIFNLKEQLASNDNPNGKTNEDKDSMTPKLNNDDTIDCIEENLESETTIEKLNKSKEVGRKQDWDMFAEQDIDSNFDVSI